MNLTFDPQQITHDNMEANVHNKVSPYSKPSPCGPNTMRHILQHTKPKQKQYASMYTLYGHQLHLDKTQFVVMIIQMYPLHPDLAKV